MNADRLTSIFVASRELIDEMREIARESTNPIAACELLAAANSLQAGLLRTRAEALRDETPDREVLSLAEEPGPEGGREPRTVGSLHVDPTALVATLDGEPLTLTKTSFEVLYFMASDPDRVWRKEELRRRFWPHTAPGRAADGVIARLRRELGAEHWIRTEWGIGWALRQPSTNGAAPTKGAA